MDNEGDAPIIRPDLRRLKQAGLIGLCLVAGLIVTGLTIRAQQSRDSARWTRSQSIPMVSYVHPIAEQVDRTLMLPGSLQAFNTAQIYARVPGYVKAWYRDIGAKVRAGELLAVIDTPDLDEQITQARADLASATAARTLAQTTSDRWAQLLLSNSVSKQEADEKSGDLAAKVARVNAAQANLDRLLALKSFARIVAPFDGVVTTRNTDIGALVNAGAGGSIPPLFTVADVHDLRLYVSVPEIYRTQIHVGMPATLSLQEFPGRSFDARLVSTSGAINQQSGTLLVEFIADNQDGELEPGGYARVTIPVQGGPSGAVRVPASTLIFRRQGLQVATITPNMHILMKPIIISQDLGAQVEVASGLSATDTVVDNPPDSLANGDLVRKPDRPH